MESIVIGVVGYGFVGRAVNQLAETFPTAIYDPYSKEFGTPEHKTRAYNADVIFINVPTDLREGRLDASIIKSCVDDFVATNRDSQSIIVIKSTVSVGTCAAIEEQYELDNVVFNPEFLSQRTAMKDFVEQKELYLAGSEENTAKVRRVYEEFFRGMGNNDVKIFETVSWEEIELLKLARNSFYGVKVGFCNYLHNICHKSGIDYDTFAQHFGRGEWVGKQHTRVPGPDGRYGYGGKCLPKDSIEMLNWYKESDILFGILDSSIKFNEEQRRLKL